MVVHLGVFMNEMTSKIFLALGQNVYGLGFARTISLLGDSSSSSKGAVDSTGRRTHSDPAELPPCVEGRGLPTLETCLMLS